MAAIDGKRRPGDMAPGIGGEERVVGIRSRIARFAPVLGNNAGRMDNSASTVVSICPLCGKYPRRVDTSKRLHPCSPACATPRQSKLRQARGHILGEFPGSLLWRPKLGNQSGFFLPRLLQIAFLDMTVASNFLRHTGELNRDIS